jgi:hypothetical protein
MAYELGADIVVTVKFRRRDGVLIDPTAWQVRVQPPVDAGSPLAEETVIYGGVAGAYVTLSTIATGWYEMLLSTSRSTLAHAGRWTLWVTSTGTGKASRSCHVVVDPPVITI